jgi:type II secretory pathway pseudopilin PulG
MMHRKVRRMQGERGASLILAIVFMVVIGAISAAVLSTTTSGVLDRVVLDQARNREYAADGAIEIAITRVRNNGGTCSSGDSPVTLEQPAVKIHVDCTSSPSFIVLPDNTIATQNNIVFTACEWSGSGNGNPCTAANTIINAQINFQGASTPRKTFVQSWSVNR